MKRIYVLLLLIIATSWLLGADFNWYSQGDARWKKDKLGTSRRSTIGSGGCVLSCISMLLNAEASNPHITPDELNEWLRRNGGYSGNNMRWQIPGQFDGSGKGLELVAQINKANDWAFLSDQMSKGNKVVVKVKGRRSHWVLVTRKCGPDSEAASYIINDPGMSEYREKTLAFFGGFKAARAYSGNWLDEEAFSLDSAIQVVPVQNDEYFLYDINSLPHPADVYVRIENKLPVTIAGYFILGLFDSDNRFVKAVDNEYVTVDSCGTYDLIYQMEDAKQVMNDDYSVKVIYSKYFSNMPSMNESIPLSENSGREIAGKDYDELDALIDSLN